MHSPLIALPLPQTHRFALPTSAPKLTFSSHPLRYLQHQLTPASDADKTGAARVAWFFPREQGYSHEQGTKPQTLGYALADSPAGLLAWIYEKLVTWTDAYPWTDDEGG